MEVMAMSPSQMKDWTRICQSVSKRLNAQLLFVNETSMGVQFPDGSVGYMYIDEVLEYLLGGN